jgi:hypothetical protein
MRMPLCLVSYMLGIKIRPEAQCIDGRNGSQTGETADPYYSTR